MHGLPTFEKKMRALNRVKRSSTTVKRVHIGSWYLEEDGEGDLVIVHSETGEKTILVRSSE